MIEFKNISKIVRTKWVLVLSMFLVAFANPNQQIDSSSLNSWIRDSNSQPITKLDCAVANNDRLTIKNPISRECLTFEIYGNGKVYVADSGTLTINSDLDIFGDALVAISPKAKLIVNGNLNLSGNSNLIVNGKLEVMGNIICQGASTACGNGQAAISGSVSGLGWCYDITLVPKPSITLVAELNSDNKSELTWTTALTDSEGYFSVERSINGMSFGAITEEQLKPVGATYTVIDEPVGDVAIYYRIVQYNKEGEVRASTITSIDQHKNGDQICQLEINPNPCVPYCNARIVDCPNGNFQTQLLDAGGNLITELIPSIDANNQINYHINRSNFLMPGVYIVNSSNDKQRLSKKLIVK